VRAGLRRGVQVCRKIPGGLDQEPGDRVVDFGGLDRGEPEADGRDGGDEGLQELPQRAPFPLPASPFPVLSVRPYMHAGEHDLRVVLRQRPCFLDEFRNRARSVGAPGDGGRAEGAVLVAAVLDLEEPASTPYLPPLRIAERGTGGEDNAERCKESPA